MKNILFAFLLCLGLLSSCSKDDGTNKSGTPGDELIFSTLVADKTTISPGKQTTITATATGYDLQYEWEATAGDILGQGAEVIYAVSPCMIGINTITCTVIDGNNNQKSKSIDIKVE